MNRMNPKVDFYFSKAKKWQQELEKLRMIVLECGLTEELKWGVPCYTRPTGSSGRAFQKSNIVLIHVFKEYCALLFFKGVLLNDANGILIQQTKNVQAARQIRTGEVQTGGTTQAEFKEIVCGKLSSFLHCQDKLYVDIRSFDAFSDIALPDPRNGSDLSDDVTVNAQFSPGNQLCVAVVRTYYEWELFMPGISMLANLGDDRRLLTAGAVFRNEPYGTSGPC